MTGFTVDFNANSGQNENSESESLDTRDQGMNYFQSNKSAVLVNQLITHKLNYKFLTSETETKISFNPMFSV